MLYPKYRKKVSLLIVCDKDVKDFHHRNNQHDKKEMFGNGRHRQCVTVLQLHRFTADEDTIKNYKNK